MMMMTLCVWQENMYDDEEDEILVVEQVERPALEDTHTGNIRHKCHALN